MEFLTPTEAEEMEDGILLKMMKDGRKSGKADTKKVLKKIGIKWKCLSVSNLTSKLILSQILL